MGRTDIGKLDRDKEVEAKEVMITIWNRDLICVNVYNLFLPLLNIPCSLYTGLIFPPIQR